MSENESNFKLFDATNPELEAAEKRKEKNGDLQKDGVFSPLGAVFLEVSNGDGQLIKFGGELSSTLNHFFRHLVFREIS